MSRSSFCKGTGCGEEIPRDGAPSGVSARSQVSRSAFVGLHAEEVIGHSIIPFELAKSQLKAFEPCIRWFVADGVTLERGRRLTDLRVLSRTRGRKKKPAVVSLNGSGDGRTRFEDNPRDETVRLGYGASRTPGVRIRGVREIQLKSLILAQPERWRRG